MVIKIKTEVETEVDVQLPMYIDQGYAKVKITETGIMKVMHDTIIYYKRDENRINPYDQQVGELLNKTRCTEEEYNNLFNEVLNRLQNV